MIKKIVLWFSLIFWCGLIFFFSAQPAAESSALSTGVTEIIINALTKVKAGGFFAFKSINIKNFEFVVSTAEKAVRKCAHFGIFAVLGIISLFLASCYLKSNIKNKLCALCFCAFYALTDEFHQLFVTGRSGRLSDVGIDTLGALTGIVVTSLFLQFVYKRKINKT